MEWQILEKIKNKKKWNERKQMREQVGEMELKTKDETAENEQKLKRCEGDLQSWHGQKKKVRHVVQDNWFECTG